MPSLPLASADITEREDTDASAIVLREPTLEEIGAIHAFETDYTLATMDGKPVAWIAFRQVEDRRWGMFGIVAEAGPEVWRKVFFKFRQPLEKHEQPVFVVCRDEAAERLLKLLGFEPTAEISAGKEIWIWKPPR